MILDDLYHDRYLVLMPDSTVETGWTQGISLQETNGSPQQSLDISTEMLGLEGIKNNSLPYDLAGLWPDTKDYDQNSPGILARAADLDSRSFASDIEKAFWLNVLRVPICVSYLAACAKVKPMTILEFGTGGDSAHSTGMFLYWLNGEGQLISVDRHYLSHVWPRYRQNENWTFIQGDSISVMKKILEMAKRYDMVFIDSSHTYPHTLLEIKQASFLTNAILLDDTTVEDVKKSMDEFLEFDKDWLKVDLAHGVTLLEMHGRISKD